MIVGAKGESEQTIELQEFIKEGALRLRWSKKASGIIEMNLEGWVHSHRQRRGNHCLEKDTQKLGSQILGKLRGQ